MSTKTGEKTKRINSKKKGVRGEEQLVNVLKSYGYKNVRRGQQYCGANGDADVIGLDAIHIECKRVERLNVYNAVEQAKKDASVTGELPAVFHRKNNKEWLVTMELDDWIKIYGVYNRVINDWV